MLQILAPDDRNFAKDTEGFIHDHIGLKATSHDSRSQFLDRRFKIDIQSDVRTDTLESYSILHSFLYAELHIFRSFNVELPTKEKRYYFNSAWNL